MFHIHVCDTLITPWLSGYSGSKYSNEVMGRWFGQYSKEIQLYILFINHPVHPV